VESRDEIIKQLKNPTRWEENFRELAVGIHQSHIEYEKKVFTAPLIGCGAGLILYSTALVKSDFSNLIVSNLIPGLWSFFLGVILSILAMTLYAIHLAKESEELICKGNAQNSFLDIRDKLWKNHRDKVDSISTNFDPSIEKSILNIINWHIEAKKLNKGSNRALKYSRIFILTSASLFILGVLIPLTILTFQTEFIWLD